MFITRVRVSGVGPKVACVSRRNASACVAVVAAVASVPALVPGLVPVAVVAVVAEAVEAVAVVSVVGSPPPQAASRAAAIAALHSEAACRARGAAGVGEGVRAGSDGGGRGVLRDRLWPVLVDARRDVGAECGGLEGRLVTRP